MYFCCRKDLTAVEIAFIRGGDTSYVPSQPAENTSYSANDQEEELEEHESPQLSSRSSLESSRELNGYLSEMPHSSGDSFVGMNRTSSRTQYLPNGHPQTIPLTSYAAPNTFPQPISHGGYPPHPYVTNGGSLPLPVINGAMPPQRQGFHPTMSSTPNDLPNGTSIPTMPHYGHANGK